MRTSVGPQWASTVTGKMLLSLGVSREAAASSRTGSTRSSTLRARTAAVAEGRVLACTRTAQSRSICKTAAAGGTKTTDCRAMSSVARRLTSSIFLRSPARSVNRNCRRTT